MAEHSFVTMAAYVARTPAAKSLTLEEAFLCRWARILLARRCGFSWQIAGQRRRSTVLGSGMRSLQSQLSAAPAP